MSAIITSFSKNKKNNNASVGAEALLSTVKIENYPERKKPLLPASEFIYPVVAIPILFRPDCAPVVSEMKVIKLPLQSFVLLKIYETDMQVPHISCFPFPAA
jgi:hypothetical protein